MEKQLYQEMYDIEEKHWWFHGRRKILYSVLKQAIGKVEKILDIGCGTGFNAQWLRGLGREVYGLEMSEEAIKFARSRAPELNIIKGEFPNHKIKEKFDIITLFDVLEHFDDDGKALAAVRDLLNPGGYVILSVPAFSFLWSEHDELAHHKRRYTGRELRDKLTAAGFEVVRLTYFNTFLFPLILVFRFLRKIFGLRAGKTDFFMAPAPLNLWLAKIFGAERFLLRYISFPFGVSLLAVVRKAN